MVKTTKWWNEFRTDAKEFQKALQRDMMLRRYQKWAAGESTVEGQIIDTAVKARTYFVTSWRLIIKRGLDVTASACALIMLSPIMLFVAIAVKLTSKGPAVLRQTRVGSGGKCFTMYKFRSMKQDAEVKSGPKWAVKNDPRVTLIGGFLRKTHLDELPQLWNVLKGEMSIVGPRPERPHFVEEFKEIIPHYVQRLCAKPGITGLAQVRSGYDDKISDVKKKVKYDVLYIKKMCPLLDIKVMAMTVLTVIFGTGR